LDGRLEFVSLEIKQDDCIITQYINRNHIVRIYQIDETVYIELVNQQILNVSCTNINILLERFIRS